MIKPVKKSTIVKLEPQEVDSPGSRSYQVMVFPRDELGNYLGPGFGDQIYFSISGAQLVGTVQDHLNGGYSQQFRIPLSRTDQKIMIRLRVLDADMHFCF
jgi:hypothetical protein